MRRSLSIALFACASANVAFAQSSERAIEAAQPQRGARRQDADRAGLEQQIHQKFARRAQAALGLNPDQMKKLAGVDSRFGQQQRDIDQRENQTRQSLRQALMEAPSADQDKRVGDLHEQLMQLQRQRFDVISAEQKELAGFMTNVQRVRFQALQENFRRQLQEGLRQQNAAQATRPGPPPR